MRFTTRFSVASFCALLSLFILASQQLWINKMIRSCSSNRNLLELEHNTSHKVWQLSSDDDLTPSCRFSADFSFFFFCLGLKFSITRSTCLLIIWRCFAVVSNSNSFHFGTFADCFRVGVGADPDVHLCRPLVRHLPSAQIPFNHRPCQNSHRCHMDYLTPHRFNFKV